MTTLRTIFSGGSFVMFSGLSALVWSEAKKDMADCALLYETHENPEPNQHAVEELERYRRSGFWNTLIHSAPQDAISRFNHTDATRYRIDLVEKKINAILS